MIEARGLTKRYGDKVAVDDLTLEITRDSVEFTTPHERGDDLVDAAGRVA